MAAITTAEEVPFAVAITNAAGQPATVDGVPVYASSDETVLTVVLDDPLVGLSGKVVSVGPGVARVSVSADADLGAGTVTIVGVSEDVTVSVDPAAQASAFAFSFGAPVPKA